MEEREYSTFVIDNLSARYNTDVLSIDNKILTHGLMGIVSEIGELFDHWKKAVFYDNRPLDPVSIIDECGDLYYYLIAILKFYGVSESLLREINYTKLLHRKTFGKNKEQERKVTENLLKGIINAKDCSST